jgi:NADH dehydrogenase/NADH:ubiquinone oxidoreductase 75 kD subunit (chain G)
MLSQSLSLTIKLNGLSVSVAEGWSLMDAARAYDFSLPALCGENGPTYGVHCRLCQVEVAGRDQLALACQTPVEDGLEISTFSPRIRRARQEALWRILTDHPTNCLYCEKSMSCKLKEYCGLYGVSSRKSELRKSFFLNLVSAPALIGSPRPVPAEVIAAKSGLKLVSPVVMT